MKKGALFIAVLLILPLLSAVEFDMKSEFSRGETLLTKISGNFLDQILSENIFFYRGHVRVPMIYNVKEINKEYYLYALLADKNPGNYSISIKDVRHMKGNKIIDEDITNNFTITENIADFSINPGFAIANDSFSFEIQNLQDYNILVSAKEFNSDESFFSFEPQEINLLPGEIKELNIKINNLPQSEIRTIDISTENLSYNIPVYSFSESITNKESPLKIIPLELNLSSPSGSILNQTFYIYNTGDITIRDISISISDSLKSHTNFSDYSIEELNPGSNISFSISFVFKTNAFVSGEVEVQAKDTSYYSSVILNSLNEISNQSSEIYLTKNCVDLNGTICNANEICTEDTINSKNGVCCLGVCQEKEEDSLKTIIGWGLIILVICILVWFFLQRYRKTKRSVDLVKLAEGKKQTIKRPSTIPTNLRKPTGNAISQQTPKSASLSIPKHIIKYVEKPIVKEKIIEKPIIKEVERIVEKPVIKEVEKIIEKPIVKEIEKRVFIERPKRPSPPRYKYKGSTNSRTYHKSSCRLAKLIKPKFKVSNNNPEYFKKQGYKPCKVCIKEKK